MACLTKLSGQTPGNLDRTSPQIGEVEWCCHGDTHLRRTQLYGVNPALSRDPPRVHGRMPYFVLNKELPMSGIYQGPGRLGRWQRLDSEKLTQNRIFGVRKNTSRSPRTGQRHDFFVLETGDWVNIVPLTSAGEVVLIRQFRHGVEDFTLEIPGGMLDPEDPSPGDGALREMREETGYDSARVEPLGIAHPNPAIQGNRCHMFVAHDCTLRGATNFDTTEETEVLLAPLSSIPDLIQSGKISHALVLCAFHYLSLQRGVSNP